jgi:hypothetical protein
MVDIAEMGYSNGVYRYLCICIDLFSKYAYAIAMPNRISNPSALISKYVFKEMGIPKAVASDDGGEFKG